MITKSELRQLLGRSPVPETLRKAEMEGLDVEELIDAIIEARDKWHDEQWPYRKKK